MSFKSAMCLIVQQESYDSYFGSKVSDLLLHHGFLVVRLHHIQLRLLGVQLSLSLLKIHVSYGQAVLLHCQVRL